jgi:hypothetical protein
MGRHVCLLLPRVGLYSELGAMLAEAFAGLGWQATVHHCADRRLLDSDLLVLAGLCGGLDGVGEVSCQRRDRRAVTALWQLEPLPPAELSPEGERIGLRAAAFDWERLPRAAQTALRCGAPVGRRLFRLARRGLALGYSRRVVREPNHQGWRDYYVSHYLQTMSEWRWLKLAHARGWVDHCFASNQTRVRFLRSRGVSAHMVPLGYHRGWGTDLHLERNIDVLYLGYIDRRPRGVKVRRLQESLAERGCALTLAAGVQGAVREELLNRARIVLSLLRMPHDLAGMRVLMGLACGALVISESCDGTGAFLPGKHFVMAGTEQLPETILHYLAHGDERRKIAGQGHRFVTQELTLTDALTKMLEHVTF